MYYIYDDCLFLNNKKRNRNSNNPLGLKFVTIPNSHK